MNNIRPLTSADFEDVYALCSKYIEKYGEEGFLWNKDGIKKSFKGFLMDRSSYVRGYFIENKMVAWMACVAGHSNGYSYVSGMTQMYYHSDLRGHRAISALYEMHEDYFNFAEKKGFHLVVTSSVLPNSSLFCKLLERRGWLSVGPGRLVRLTKFHPSQTQAQNPAAPARRPSSRETAQRVPNRARQTC